MPAFRGNAWQIGFAHQVAEGTTLTPTQHYRWGSGTSVDPTKKTTQEYEGNGSIDPTFINTESSIWKGKLTYYPRPVDIGQLLCGISGTSSETVKSTALTATPSATAGGSLAAGTFHYALCYVYNGIEGPLSTDMSVTSAASNNTATFASIPADAAATKIRIYKGLVGGASGVYSQYADVTVATTVTDTGTVPAFTAQGTNSLIPTTAFTGAAHLFNAASYLDFWTAEIGQVITAAGAPSNQIKLWLADTMFTDITLEGDPNKPLKVTIGFISKYALPQSSLTGQVLDPAARPFIYGNSIFTLDGTTNAFVSKLKLTYKLTVDESLIYSHVWPETFLAERRSVDATYELLFQDASQYYKFLSGGVSTTPTTGQIVDTPAVATGTLQAKFYAGATDGNNQLGFYIPNLNYDISSVKPDLTGKPFMVPVKAFATPPSSGSLMQFGVRNSQTTTY